VQRGATVLVGNSNHSPVGEIDPAKMGQWLRVLSQTNPRKVLIYGLGCESTLNFGRIVRWRVDFPHRWLVLIRPVATTEVRRCD